MRIAALGLKSLPYDYAAMHLAKNGGGQRTPGYRKLNPDTLVTHAGR